MKKEETENTVKIKIIVLGDSFQSAVAKYKKEMVLRDSVGLAEIIVHGETNQGKSLQTERKTDLFIILQLDFNIIMVL